MIATTIIELAKAGERNVDVLCEAALNVHTGAVSAANRDSPDESQTGINVRVFRPSCKTDARC
jgi:hypothetical protein